MIKEITFSIDSDSSRTSGSSHKKGNIYLDLLGEVIFVIPMLWPFSSLLSLWLIWWCLRLIDFSILLKYKIKCRFHINLNRVTVYPHEWACTNLEDNSLVLNLQFQSQELENDPMSKTPWNSSNRDWTRSTITKKWVC